MFKFPIDLLGNNSLWSVIYPISTDMFMACTVKYTKNNNKTMKQKHIYHHLAHYPDNIEVNKESFDHRVIIRCMNIFAQQKLQVMVFSVLLQTDMTIEIYGHAANVSNNVFRWQQHAHREKIDSLKWGAGFPSYIQLINVAFKFCHISF